ncbi:hypothetical protein BT69DRAFT_576358 [Atractiella rhizophila]|nr:hypothetical protein BT69DRAFT_576358 [Atractiella rhizophila]
MSYGPPSGPPPPFPPSNQPPYPPPNAGYGAPGGYAPPAGGYAPPAGAPAPARGAEDPFTALTRYDTVFLVDDSGSMEMFWDETRNAMEMVVSKAVQYDADGIDMYFFNSTHVAQSVSSAQEVRKIFNQVWPTRSTPTAAALKRILDPYVAALEAQKASGGPKLKPLNLIVLTDGAPDRNQDPEPVIVDIARRLDAGRFPLFQVGIQFIQIGNDDEATAHLTRLDDDLKKVHKIRDMCDTTPATAVVSGDKLLKALLGGLNRKVDSSG